MFEMVGHGTGRKPLDPDYFVYSGSLRDSSPLRDRARA